ncbi:MAG: methanogenesis marker 2 protein [Thermoplasmatales archaeon]|nr:methanogenesis marker 2 protein [Thermoplasmatales archaeon]
MDLGEIVKTIRSYPGVTRKNVIRDVVKYLPLDGFPNVAASLGEDAAAIEFKDGYLLFAADGIMESLLNSDPFYAGYFAILVNVSDIAAMGGKPLGMVDVMSVKDHKVCCQVMRGMGRAVKKFNVPVVGGHTHPDCKYQAIDVSIVGFVPKGDIIRSNTARVGDDVVFAMDLDGFFPSHLPYAYDTTSRKEDSVVQEQIGLMARVAAERIVTAAKDMSNPGCLGTLGMLLESSDKGAVVDIDAIPRPEGVDLIQWLLAYMGYGFVLTCDPSNTGRLIELFEGVGVACAKVGRVEGGNTLRIRNATGEAVLFDFGSDIITGCGPYKKKA